VIQRVFAIGVMGALALSSGCSSTPAPDPLNSLPELTAEEEAAGMKQVTIAVTGMT